MDLCRIYAFKICCSLKFQFNESKTRNNDVSFESCNMMCVHLAEKGTGWFFFCDTELGFSVSFMNYRFTIGAECFVGYEQEKLNH